MLLCWEYLGNWVFMLVANKADQNVFTQNEGAAANDRGHIYTVSFDAGPAVYAEISQATAAGDQIAVELLRPDGKVLKKHLVAPGKLVLDNYTFTYQGDGAGCRGKNHHHLLQSRPPRCVADEGDLACESNRKGDKVARKIRSRNEA